MVVSHERSGTHFLMNSIAKCFDYISNPWVNFDGLTLATNFYCAEAVDEFFSQFRGHSVANIIKSHHQFSFFEPVLDSITKEFHIFYVYRDPRDVMVSFWRYLNQLSWHEGPTVETAKELIRSAPEGNLLRYQRKQEGTMIHRWRTHVTGWMLDLPERFRPHVTFVRFSDLNRNYESTIRSMAPTLGPPARIEKPSLQESSILPAAGMVGGYGEYFDENDLELFCDIAGDTMERLGFHCESVSIAS
jgi:hypothetical protein